jgi:hypothetical protein
MSLLLRAVCWYVWGKCLEIPQSLLCCIKLHQSSSAWFKFSYRFIAFIIIMDKITSFCSMFGVFSMTNFYLLVGTHGAAVNALQISVLNFHQIHFTCYFRWQALSSENLTDLLKFIWQISTCWSQDSSSTH